MRTITCDWCGAVCDGASPEDSILVTRLAVICKDEPLMISTDLCGVCVESVRDAIRKAQREAMQVCRR